MGPAWQVFSCIEDRNINNNVDNNDFVALVSCCCFSFSCMLFVDLVCRIALSLLFGNISSWTSFVYIQIIALYSSVVVFVFVLVSY